MAAAGPGAHADKMAKAGACAAVQSRLDRGRAAFRAGNADEAAREFAEGAAEGGLAFEARPCRDLARDICLCCSNAAAALATQRDAAQAAWSEAALGWALSAVSLAPSADRGKAVDSVQAQVCKCLIRLSRSAAERCAGEPAAALAEAALAWSPPGATALTSASLSCRSVARGLTDSTAPALKASGATSDAATSATASAPWHSRLARLFLTSPPVAGLVEPLLPGYGEQSTSHFVQLCARRQGCSVRGPAARWLRLEGRLGNEFGLWRRAPDLAPWTVTIDVARAESRSEADGQRSLAAPRLHIRRAAVDVFCTTLPAEMRVSEGLGAASSSAVSVGSDGSFRLEVAVGGAAGAGDVLLLLQARQDTGGRSGRAECLPLALRLRVAADAHVGGGPGAGARPLTGAPASDGPGPAWAQAAWAPECPVGRPVRVVPAGDDARAWVGLAGEEGSMEGRVWDAAAGLCQMLARPEGAGRAPSTGRTSLCDLVRGRLVVDIGSGTGLAGIAAALLCRPAALAVTDLEGAVPGMAASVALNGLAPVVLPRGGEAPVLPAGAARDASRREIFVGALPWGDAAAARAVMTALRDAAPAAPPAPVLLLADVVYDPEGYEPLLATLLHLLRDAELTGETRATSEGPSPPASATAPAAPGAPAPVALLAYRHRRPEAARFFAAAKREGLSFRLVAGGDPLGIADDGDAPEGSAGGAVNSEPQGAVAKASSPDGIGFFVVTARISK